MLIPFSYANFWSLIPKAWPILVPGHTNMVQPDPWSLKKLLIPITRSVIPDPRVAIPDPTPLIPDPIYLVTTLSFSNGWANFHSRFLCCQCVFDPVPLGTLSLFSCAFEFSSNLICWRPKEIYRRAKNQCHCCGIYHFQRPDLICETPASDPATPPSMRFPCSREKSIRQKRR